MDSRKEEQFMRVWHMVEGPGRAESLGVIGDFDRSSFREMLWWKGNSSELKSEQLGEIQTVRVDKSCQKCGHEREQRNGNKKIGAKEMLCKDGGVNNLCMLVGIIQYGKRDRGYRPQGE